MGGGYLKTTRPRPLPGQENVSFFLKVTQLLLVAETQDPWLPVLQSFQQHKTISLLWCFLFVFPSFKSLETDCRFGDQILSLLHFNIWSMEQFVDRGRRKRERKSRSSIPKFSCPENLNSSGFWLPFMLWRPKTLSSKGFLALRSLNYIGLALIPEVLFLNTEVYNNGRRRK